MVRSVRLRLAVDGGLLAHAVLVGLVLSVCVIAGVLGGCLLAVVGRVALGVRCIVLPVGNALLAMLETACLRWAEGVCSPWGTEVLVLVVRRILLAVLWLLVVALRRVLGLLVVVALCGVLRAVGLLVVGIVRPGHCMSIETARVEST